MAYSERKEMTALLFIGPSYLEYKQMGVFSETSLEKTSTWKRDIFRWGKGKEMITVLKYLKGCYSKKKKSIRIISS